MCSPSFLCWFLSTYGSPRKKCVQDSTLKITPSSSFSILLCLFSCFGLQGPWAARYAVTGKPVIIGNKLPIQFMYVPPSPDGTMAEYLECDLDIGNSSIMARNIVTLCKRCTSELIIDFAFLVEGTAEDELPEHLMGAMRAYRLDPDHSPLFPGAEYGVNNTVITTTANNNNNSNTAIIHVTRSNEDDETDDEFWDCQSTY